MLAVVAVALSAATYAGVAVSSAGATTPSTGGYEIDGDLVVNHGGTDWLGSLTNWTRDGSGCHSTATNPPALPKLICDPVKTDATTFPGGAKESDPSGWFPLQSSQVTPKTDISNVYADGVIDSGFTPAHPVFINGMERLPKAGDVHLDFEFNQNNMQAGGTRSVGDLLIAYDLGGSVNTNSNALEVRVYKAKAGLGCSGSCPGYDYSNPDATVTGTGLLQGSGVTATMNTASIASGPWQSYDDHYNLVNTIQPFGFAEASIDLADPSLGLGNVCVNYITVKSRSSESVTSQLKDTTGTVPFPFCGGLHIKKFLDYNANGVRDTSLDPAVYGAANTTEPYVAGWEFKVFTQGANPLTATPVCDQTTATPSGGGDPVAVCTGLTAGNYDIYEVQHGDHSVSTDIDYFNTVRILNGTSDTTVDTSATPKLSGAVSVGGTTNAVFGNACYVKKTFQVTSVPSGVTPYAWYKIKTGSTLGSKVKVPLSQVGTTSTWQGDETNYDLFTDATQIAWGYGVTVNGTDEDVAVKDGSTAADTESFAGSGVSCTKTNTTVYDSSTVSGIKFKDVNANGVKDAGAALEVGLPDFAFKLMNGTAQVGSTVYSCGSTAHPCSGTDPVGTYKFVNVNPGIYTIVEDLTLSPTGWAKVGTLQSGTVTVTPSVTVTLGSDPSPVNYGNTPLSKIKVTFLPDTSPASTQASSVSCAPSGGSNLTLDHTSGTNDWTTPDLHLGTYTCTVVITDP